MNDTGVAELLRKYLIPYAYVSNETTGIISFKGFHDLIKELAAIKEAKQQKLKLDLIWLKHIVHTEAQCDWPNALAILERLEKEENK